VVPSERRQGGRRERRRAVDYERDTGESHRRRCPSRSVPRGTTSLRCGDRCARPRQVGARHRPSEMQSAAARGMVDEGTDGFECTQCRSEYTKPAQMCMAGAEAVGADGHGACAHGMRRL
jgi:hypothetical protein